MVSNLVHALPVFEPWSFDRPLLVELGRTHAAAYRAARPYPHAIFDGMLGADRCSAITDAVPSPAHAGWKRRDYAEQSARLGQLQRSGFEGAGSPLRWLLAELNGLAFLEFLAALTGRRDLIGDPHFTGAGPLVTLPGGHLAIHSDFNRDSARHLDRAVTALYYAPRTWDDAWGGELELWNREQTRCEARIAPRPDRLVVMDHGEDHWHGHPSPVTCPDGEARIVIAAYYYVARAGADDDADAHGAIWGHGRP